MWAKFVEKLRTLGPRKLAIIAVVAAIAVVLAYGDNSSDDYANGQTLPRAALSHQALRHQALGHQAPAIPAPAGRHTR